MLRKFVSLPVTVIEQFATPGEDGVACSEQAPVRSPEKPTCPVGVDPLPVLSPTVAVQMSFADAT